MNIARTLRAAVATIAVMHSVGAPCVAQTPVGTTFTYQGVLKSNNAPYSGSADMRFTLFDSFAAGSAIGLPLEIPNVAVAGGVFTAELYFNAPNAFNGEARWLGIEVRTPAGGGAYVPLAPRQEVTAAPYALYAVNANTPFTYSAGNAIFTGGSVGIGTTTPSVKLEVTGGRALIGDGPADEDALLTIGADFSDDFSYGGSALSVGHPTAASLNVGTSVDNWLSLSAASGLGYPLIQSNGPGGMALRTNGSDRIRITGAGDVGIGTAAPLAKLHVAGDVALLGDGFGLTLRGFSNNLIGRINRIDLPGAGLMIADHATGPIQFATSTSMGAAGERMRVTPQGDVGIGTTSPLAKLHVAGDVSLLGNGFGLTLRGFSDNLIGRINRIDLPGGGLMIADHATGPIQFATSTSMGAAGERMRVTADGNVGIGTTTPLAKLHVGGDVSVLGDGFGLTLRGFSDNLLGRINRLDFPGSGLTIADHATGPIVLATSTSMGAAGERLRVTPDGRVGINNTNPQRQVHVGNTSAANTGMMRFESSNGPSWRTFDIGVPTTGSPSTGEAFSFVIDDVQLGSTPEFIVEWGTGNVGIGTLEPFPFKLAVNGTAANSTGSWSVFSDARLKTNIGDLPEGTLDRLLSLRGRTFEYTPQAQRTHFGGAGTQTGFIAQEVQSVFPEWVAEDDDGHLYITERGTTALVVEALRELRAEKDAQIAALECSLQVRDREAAALRDEVKDLRELVGRLLAKEEGR